MSVDLKRYRADKTFYKKVMVIALPMALQSVLSSCMGIVDSLMVSWIGMVSAVGTAAQLDMMASMAAVGIVSGVGIYLAQYYGAKDEANFKKTFGLSLVLAAIVGTIFSILTLAFGKTIIKFYMDDADIIKNGWEYLRILGFGFLPATLGVAFSSAYRAMGKTAVSLKISIVTMTTNCVLNYLLIFGKFGFPKMGVAGAALATVISYCVGLAVHIIYAIKTKQEFMGSFSEMFSFSREFFVRVVKRAMPLLVNELLFGFGSTLFIKAFGALGTSSMDAYFVGSKISDVFFFAVSGIYSAAGTVLGNTLGSGDLDRAQAEGRYLMGLSAVMAVVSVALIVIFAAPMVSFFGLSNPESISSAIAIVRVFGIKIALRLFIVIIFSALRAGGDSKTLTLLDCGIMWVVGLPIAFAAVHLFHMQNIALVFLVVQLEQAVRLVWGMKRYHSGKWAVNLTREL